MPENIIVEDDHLSNTIYFEMMPKNVTKGKALKTLCDLTNLQINNTIAVGDYYNDVEILQNAGLSVCVDNAPDVVKHLKMLKSNMDYGMFLPVQKAV